MNQSNPHEMSAPADASRTQTSRLAMQVMDESMNLVPALLAHTAIEKLVMPGHANDADETLTASRAELGSLLHIVNDALKTRVARLTHTTAVLDKHVNGHVDGP